MIISVKCTALTDNNKGWAAEKRSDHLRHDVD